MVLLFCLLIIKHPSASMNPNIQFGFEMFLISTLRRATGIILEKRGFKLGDSPRFKEERIAKIFSPKVNHFYSNVLS